MLGWLLWKDDPNSVGAIKLWEQVMREQGALVSEMLEAARVGKE